jgi:HEPN domain-containing protein
MTKDEHIEYWLSSAENDLVSAEILLSNKRYDWALFIGHLVLEKSLKALFVKDHVKHPPKTHNLLILTEESSLEFSSEIIEFLDHANSFNLETRYPTYKYEFYKIVDKDIAEQNFNKIKDLYLWLKLEISKK